MIYKNVHSRVKKLHKLNLIQAVEKESDHAAKYYRLSIGGLYNLIYKRRKSFLRLFKRMLENHGDNIIFNTFLYPYFNRATMMESTLSLISFSKVCSYLYDCCDVTETELDSIKSANPFLLQEEASFCLGSSSG